MLLLFFTLGAVKNILSVGSHAGSGNPEMKKFSSFSFNSYFFLYQDDPSFDVALLNVVVRDEKMGAAAPSSRKKMKFKTFFFFFQFG